MAGLEQIATPNVAKLACRIGRLALRLKRSESRGTWLPTRSAAMDTACPSAVGPREAWTCSGRGRRSGEDFMNNPGVFDPGQTLIKPLKREAQLAMINSQLVQ